MMRAIFYYICLFLLFSITSAAPAHAWEGKVVSIADGDTITVLAPDNRQVRVRLYGIDCPERRQAFGNRARQAIASAAAGKTVNIETMDTDRYGRTVAVVTISGGDILQELLLESGMAWVYPQYCKDCSGWYDLEAEAREARRGLWLDGNPVPPWKWRGSRK